MKRLLLPLVSSILIAGQAHAFLIKNIRLDGLQRVSAGTVYNAFPVVVGDDVNKQQLAEAVRSLFKIGYFEDIRLSRDGDTLVVKLTEYPTINEIKIEGNKAISTENLKKGLKQSGLSEGDIYKPATLEEMRQALEQQYVSQGRYNASVEIKVTPQPRNRADILLKINEGKTASIKGINIVGTHAFQQKELLKLFQLRVSAWNTWLSSDDKYSREKLSGDIERLRSHYMDRGYINFQILSSQVSVTPDKSQIYITINIDEGGLYKIGKIKLAGDLVFSEQEIRELITIKTGDIFSRSSITETEDAIAGKIGNKGYIFANINALPEINNKTHMADITFSIMPGKQIYVRHINFHGNTRTRDEVLRREMRQFEGSLANNLTIKDSTARLNRIGYFKDSHVKTTPVPNTDNQIDLNYSVEEHNSGSLVGSIGFSQIDGFLIGGSINQANFMGTGNAVSLSASSSKYTHSYNFSYNNPYYTTDGVSRGFNLYYNATDYNKIDITNYNLDRFGGDMSFGYPITDTSRLSLSLGAEKTQVKQGNTPAYFVEAYLKKNGSSFDTLSSSIAWSESELNYGLLPTAGHSQSANLTLALPGSSETFYKLAYTGQYIKPLGRSFSFKLHVRLGFGHGFSSDLPFYENFFAGGFGSVRGFEYGTLGPQALQHDGDRDPIGGNAMASGGIALLFPLPFIEDQRSVQTSLFIDTGNVWSTYCNDDVVQGDASVPNAGKKLISNCNKPRLDDLRYSAGIGLTWLTPLGPLTFSLAKPIHSDKTDKSQVFQFSLGNTF